MKRSVLIALLALLVLTLASCGGESPREANAFALELLKENNTTDQTTGILVRYDTVKSIPEEDHFIPMISMSNLYYETFDDYVIDLLVATQDDTRVNIYQANDGSEAPPKNDKGEPVYDYPLYVRLLNKGEALILHYPAPKDKDPQFQLAVSNPKHYTTYSLGPRQDKITLLQSEGKSEGPTNSKVFGVKRDDIIVRADKSDLQLVEKYKGDHVAFIEEYQLNEMPSDSGYFDEEVYTDQFYLYSQESDKTFATRITSAQNNQYFEVCTIGEDEDTKTPFIVEILYQGVFHRGESFAVQYNDAQEIPNIAVLAYHQNGDRAQQLLYAPSYDRANHKGDKFFKRENYSLDGKYAIIGYEDEANLLQTDN